MSYRKYKIFNYVDGFNIEQDILVPCIKKKEIAMTSTKRFHNCLHLILGLSKLERMLIDWISEEMDDNNIIRNDSFNRGLFIKFINEISIKDMKIIYRDQSVNNAFLNLKNKGLLLSVKRGIYQVNPEYYWSGSDKDRENEILLNLRFSSKNTNFKVLNGGKYDIKIIKR